MSSPGFPDSLYYASEFMLGVGMVILQPATARVVIVHETRAKYWFLPKGRKDVGESLQEAALREAYEEVR
jgi:8-oxo-dGTP pyrophosphatase MutT (NUDIX family)